MNLTVRRPRGLEDRDRIELKAEEPGSSRPTTFTRHDRSHIPLKQFLRSGDNILLLTPAVAVEGGGTPRGQDPFESLGRAISYRHAGVKHVPYTARNGITSTHIGFVKTATVVLFIVSGRPDPGQIDQIDLAREVQQCCRSIPLVLIVPEIVSEVTGDFSTVLQVPDLIQENLGLVAEVLFAERS